MERYVIKISAYDHRYKQTHYYGTKHVTGWGESVSKAKESLEHVKEICAVYKNNINIPSTIIQDHLLKYGEWEMLCENGDFLFVTIIRKLNKQEWLDWLNNKLSIRTLGIYKRHNYQKN